MTVESTDGTEGIVELIEDHRDLFERIAAMDDYPEFAERFGKSPLQYAEQHGSGAAPTSTQWFRKSISVHDPPFTTDIVETGDRTSLSEDFKTEAHGKGWYGRIRRSGCF